MRKCFVLFILLSAQQLFAQEKFGPKNKIGVVFSADLCYRTLVASQNTMMVSESRNAMEIPRFGFTTGISFIHSFKNFAVETGAQYSSKGEQTDFFTLNFAQPQGFVPSEVKFIYMYNYIDVPLKLLYNFNISKVNFFVGAGTSANIFLQDRVVVITKYADGSEKRSNGEFRYNYSPINIAAIASFGVDLPVLSNKARLRIEPIYRQSITSIIETPVKGYLYSTGLNAGLFVGI